MDGSPLAQASVYLPKAAGWCHGLECPCFCPRYSIHDGEFKPPGVHVHKLDLDSIPAYYKAGTAETLLSASGSMAQVVPLKSRIRRSSACMSLDPFTLNVYLDASGQAKGLWTSSF